MEKTVGIVPWTHKWLNNQKNKAKSYIGTNDHNKWMSSAGEALVVFGQLQKHVGWQPFKDYFRYCREKNPKAANNQDKIDSWVVQMSLLCKQDLRPFFQDWTWPLSDKVKRNPDLARLPAFKPNYDEVKKL